MEVQKGLSGQAPSSGILPRYSGNPVTAVSLSVLWILQAWNLTIHCPPDAYPAYSFLLVTNVLWESSPAPALNCEPHCVL